MRSCCFSALVLVVALIACSDDTRSTPDGPLLNKDGKIKTEGSTAREGGTSLVGPIQCGTSTCTSGQLCVTHLSGIDRGTLPPPAGTCTDAPQPCTDLHDCVLGSSSCGSCADRVCYPTSASSVNGRNVTCMGQ